MKILLIAALAYVLPMVVGRTFSGSLNNTLMRNDVCPPWQYRNDTTRMCLCDKEGIPGVVACNNYPYSLMLHECYYMTYKQQLQVGSCMFTCHRAAHGFFLNITVNSSAFINEAICGAHERQGQMCGSCMDGYAPPVYSYSLSCVNCTTSNWAKYTAVSLLPVTGFFIFVVTFRLSATSPKLHGLILFSQIVSCPSNMRSLYIVLPIKLTLFQQHIAQGLSSFFGIWNLDFLRLVYTPFCLHPHTNTLQVLALDYIIAIYPLLLIALSYLLVLLYDRNVSLVVCLWKPFVPLFMVSKTVEHQKFTSGCLCYFSPPLVCQDSQCVCGPPDACSDL